MQRIETPQLPATPVKSSTDAGLWKEKGDGLQFFSDQKAEATFSSEGEGSTKQQELGGKQQTSLLQ